jgi:DNA-directed RNA polymerase specialized sigma subunit
MYADYYSAACEGLVKAAVIYDSSKGTFSSLAYKYALRQVLNEMQRNEHQHLSVGECELRNYIKVVCQRDGYTIGHNITLEEIVEKYGEAWNNTDSHHLRLTKDSIHRILEASPNTSLYSEEYMQDIVSFHSKEQSAYDMLVDIHYTTKLYELSKATLSPVQFDIVMSRVGHGETEEDSFKDIGSRHGVSREGARLQYNIALCKLKHPMVVNQLL